MTPPYISDPVPARRRTGRKSSIMSAPVLVMMIAAVAGIPSIANRLASLDATLHANNDAIVFYMLRAAPFVFVGVAVLGLWMMFGGKPPQEAPSEEFFDSWPSGSAGH